MMRITVMALAIGLSLVALPRVTVADGAWLDQPPAPWNAPGMSVPSAPPPEMSAADPRCAAQQRPPETDEDAAVAAAGWALYNIYQAGWGVKAISALSGYDGMCRPWGYQVFVFVDGAFAGTVSPEPMNSRTDGALSTAVLMDSGERVQARFLRYADTDPLCCPTRTTTVLYRIDRGAATPVLVPERASTDQNQ